MHVASAALQRFSKRFFKELHLLDACLELLADAVPNVRLAAARLLPCLKLTIRLPEDVDYLVGPGPGCLPPLWECPVAAVQACAATCTTTSLSTSLSTTLHYSH